YQSGGSELALVGGEGADLVTGGDGRDVLLGGFGADRFSGWEADHVVSAPAAGAADQTDDDLGLAALWSSTLETGGSEAWRSADQGAGCAARDRFFAELGATLGESA